MTMPESAANGPERTRKIVHKNTAGSVYVGRPTFLGNPYVIGRDGDRQTVISKYRDWFYDKVKNEPGFADRVRTACADYDLACWCAPLPCHAEVIREFLDG